MKNRYFVAIAWASVLALGALGPAQAVPSYGYAEIDIRNFSLTGVFGTPGVNIITQSVLISADANYPGFPDASATAAGNIVTGGDVVQQTSGPGPFPGENVFSQALLASSGTRGDGLITGAIVGGASSNMVAEGRLTVPGSAGSSAGSNTTITAQFTVTTGTVVSLTFDALAQLFTSVGQLGDTATAQLSASYVITRSDGFVIRDTSPDELNESRSSQIPGVNGVYNLGLTSFAFADTLAPGTYTLVLSDNVREQLTAVAAIPEPGSLGLLALGLLALGAARRHRVTN